MIIIIVIKDDLFCYGCETVSIHTKKGIIATLSYVARLSRHVRIMHRNIKTIYIIKTFGLFIINHATIKIGTTTRGLEYIDVSWTGGAFFEKPYWIAWMNMKWINVHIVGMDLHLICGTDVYVIPFTPCLSTQGGRRTATIWNKRELAGGRWGIGA